MRAAVALMVWMVAWLLWSGLYKPLLITLGVLSCVLVYVLARRMDLMASNSYGFDKIGVLLPFWGWLIGEIVKANIVVARIVLSPNMPISPRVIKVDAISPDAFGQAVLGNAITLTPGSVTLDDHEGKLFVHCLTQEGAADLLEGEMNRRVGKLPVS